MNTALKILGWKAIHGGVERLPAPLAARALTRLMPRWLVIEPTNRCNLRCPLCPNSFHPRERGRMQLAEFRALADDVRPYANNICLNLLGESLLNPELFDFVAYAESIGVPCSVTTNGQLLDRYIEPILDSRLSTLKIAIDGADRETHERYRVGSDFERIRHAVEELCRRRAELGLAKPHVTILNLVFRFNYGQQDELRRWARAIGADRIGFKPVWIGVSEFSDRSREELAAEYLPDRRELLHDGYTGEHLARAKRVCPSFYEGVVLWNGDVVPCTRCAYDGREAFGNVFRDGGFDAVWGSERHVRTLERILRHESDMCSRCDCPSAGKWLDL